MEIEPDGAGRIPIKDPHDNDLYSEMNITDIGVCLGDGQTKLMHHNITSNRLLTYHIQS